VPRLGEAVEADSHRLTVSELDGRRVARVRIDPIEKTEDDKTAAQEAS
jgi:CBS domain containing-hemolysin-like protein